MTECSCTAESCTRYIFIALLKSYTETRVLSEMKAGRVFNVHNSNIMNVWKYSRYSNQSSLDEWRHDKAANPHQFSGVSGLIICQSV